MLSLLNFTLCAPDDDDLSTFGEYAGGIQFLKSENGVKWYEAQKEFLSDTLKVAYISSGFVVAINSDVSKLFPINMSVIEVEALPENCTAGNITNGSWKVEGGQVVYSPRTEEVISE